MKYQIITRFESDRELADIEELGLIISVETQVMEPQYLPGPERDWEDAEWVSSNVLARIEKGWT